MAEHDETRTSRWLAPLRLLPGGLLLPLVGVLLATFATFTFSEVAVRAAKANSRGITAVLERLETIVELRALMLDAETAQRGFLLTADPGMLEVFSAAASDIGKVTARLPNLAAAPNVRSRLDAINALATERLEMANTTMTLAREGRVDEATELVRRGNDKRIMDSFRAELLGVELESRAELAARQSGQNMWTLWSRIAVVLSCLLILGLLVTVTRLLAEQVARQRELNEEAEHEAEVMHQLVAAKTAELSALTSHLQDVTEEEKAELARNLHDELGGLLTAARMDLSWLQNAARHLGDDFKAKLDELEETLSVAMDTKRRVVESLRPALLDHFGLPTALQSYFDDTCKKAELNCTIDFPDDLPALSRESSIALFRIAQESLTNILRHAEAANVTISMGIANDRFRLTIGDDGRGLDLNRPKSGGLHGINGMRHRMQSLGGNFVIASTPGGGTTIEVLLPLARHALISRSAA